jgi:hypothetical protein
MVAYQSTLAVRQAHQQHLRHGLAAFLRTTG